MKAVLVGRSQENEFICIGVDQLPVVGVVSKQERETGIPGIFFGIPVFLQAAVIEVRNIKARSVQPDILMKIFESIIPFFVGFRQTVDEIEIIVQCKIVCQSQGVYRLDSPL